MNEMRSTARPFDRTVEDLGNIVELGHVNVTIPDQRLATIFYVSGLGLTRDPYLMTGVENMWVNVGRSQFHLPASKPQVVRGVTGLVVPDLDALRRRLESVRPQLKDTSFAVADKGACIEATCPWGNQIRLHAPDPRLGAITLGIPYVEFAVPTGSLGKIERFYREILSAQAEVATDAVGRHARIAVGDGQHLIYREDDAPQPEFDGHHVQITLVDFSGPYFKLLERDLITREDDQHQWRFQDIVDLDTGAVLFTVEHEVRSMRHPMFARPLVNRDSARSNRTYAPGAEDWRWALPRG